MPNQHFYVKNPRSPTPHTITPLLFILGGEHTRTKTVVTSKVSALAAFTKKKATCLGCRSVLTKEYENEAVCGYCKEKEGAIYQQELSNHRMLEDRFAQLFTECQRCQGSLHEEVLCTSRDCPIFYVRKKVQVELEGSKWKIDRFGVPLGDE